MLRVVEAQEQQQQLDVGPPNKVSANASGTSDEPIELDDEFALSRAPVSFLLVKLFPPDKPLARHTRAVCVGHPGSEDLEVDAPGVKSNYDMLHVSEGRSRGHAKDQDIFDISEIGALMHDCWTYWGHSGAPIIDRVGGTLIGLHSSSESETGMRRGIALPAIRQFLQQKGHAK